MKAIEAHDLSKVYRLDAASAFEALKNISFSIEEGESIGIIGANGAGKSTLLKVLSGITLPSSGTAKIVGSFSSLLEVGTGFHPDLSGKDNIFLNASILGISKKVVETELTHIIEFSGVQEFIDQPLRTYSSGMKLRLAFAVIAHLKTDIIALDEVLAVGDSMFQIKCMERIFEFKDQGRTILFVSHNLSAVRKLCKRCLILRNGEIVFDGPTDSAIDFYLQPATLATKSPSEFVESITNNCTENSAAIQLDFRGLNSDNEVDLGINISTIDGNPLYHFSNRFTGTTLKVVDRKLSVTVEFAHLLKSGNYQVSVYLGQNEERLVWLENVATLVVPPHNPYNFHNPDSIQASVVPAFTMRQH